MSIREEQKEQRYAQLLMVGLDEFIHKGYYGTSTREIAKKAGISSGLMFHYFESKQALYEAIVEMGCGKMDEWINDTKTNPLELLKNVVSQIFFDVQNNPVYCKMFIFMDQAQRNKEISEKVADLLSGPNIIEQTVPLIERGQKEGLIRGGDALSLSMTFWCAVQGVAQGKADAPHVQMPSVDWLISILM